ncbi:DUF1566 domain-containing protein [Myxococcota bacterium]
MSVSRPCILLFACVLNAGCNLVIDMDEGARCDGPDQCPEGYRCIDGRCKESGPTCGDYVVDDGEACDDGNQLTEPECDYGTPTCEICRADCQEEVNVTGRYCGDRTRDPEEACDDGYTDSSGSCNGDCTAAGSGVGACGDGVWCRENNEVCDDGFSDDCGSCNATCTAPGTGANCGDGTICPESEACDDGYTDSCGSCNEVCTGPGTGLGACGDGLLCGENNEICDDGYTDVCGTCNEDCSDAGIGLGVCGDGTWCPENDEACDDGSTDPCGSCNSDCTAPGTGIDPCIPDELRCNGAQLERCAIDGCGWTVVDICPCGCTLADCVAPICASDAYQCNGDDREQCDSNGCNWDFVQTCAHGCVDSTCYTVTWLDASTGLEWENPSSGLTVDWTTAGGYCGALVLDGHDDWRLPNIDELRSLVRGCSATETGGSCGVTELCLEDACRNSACDGCTGESPYHDAALEGPTNELWSSSEGVGLPPGAWFMDLSSSARVGRSGQGNPLFARCVRDGS